jgi:gas vesicle protein
MSNSKAALGFLAGAAAGAILGILFAPEKGEETRKKISRKTGDLGDSLKTTFGDFIDGLTSKYEDVKQDASGIYEKGREKAGNMKAEVKNNFS